MKNIIFTFNQINEKFGFYELIKPKLLTYFIMGFFINLLISVSLKLSTLNSLSNFIHILLVSSSIYLLVTLFIVAVIIIASTSIYMFNIRHILFDEKQSNSKVLKIFFPLFFLIGIKKFYSRSDYLDRECICCRDKLQFIHFTLEYLSYERTKCNVAFVIDLKYNNIKYLRFSLNGSDYVMEKYMEDKIPKYSFISSDKYFEEDILTEIKTINNFFCIIRKYEDNIIFL